MAKKTGGKNLLGHLKLGKAHAHLGRFTRPDFLRQGHNQTDLKQVTALGIGDAPMSFAGGSPGFNEAAGGQTLVSGAPRPVVANEVPQQATPVTPPVFPAPPVAPSPGTLAPSDIQRRVGRQTMLGRSGTRRILDTLSRFQVRQVLRRQAGSPDALRVAAARPVIAARLANQARLAGARGSGQPGAVKEARRLNRLEIKAARSSVESKRSQRKARRAR